MTKSNVILGNELTIVTRKNNRLMKLHKRRESLKKICNRIATVMIVIMVAVTVMLVGVKVLGLQVFSVLSGSMEPTYSTGSLIYVKKADTDKLKKSQAITYQLDENTVVTHRIVEIIKDEKNSKNTKFRTKGDANNVVDGTLVHNKNVIGTPIFSIPYMGYVANFIERPTGKRVLIIFAAGILLWIIPGEVLRFRKMVDEKTAAEQAGETAVN